MPFRALHEEHQTVAAQFGKLEQAHSMLDQARQQLTSLTKLGDMVTPEDVIKAAGRLVATGLSPLALAKLLSDMPEQGEQLQGWLAQHVEQITQREQQLGPVMAQARQALAVTGMKSMAGREVEQKLGLPVQPSPAAAPSGPVPAGTAGRMSAGPSGNSLIPEQPNTQTPIG